MYCHQCGKEVGDANYCPYCGAQLKVNLNSQTDYSSYQPIHQQYSHQASSDDAPSVGFAILSFLVPIIGLVLFVVWNKDYPLKAKSCLKGLIVGVIVYFISVCCLLSAASQASPDVYNDFYLSVEMVLYG